MLYIILAWIFWFLFCFNIGFFILGFIFPNNRKNIDFFYNFWFGLFLLITILEFISLFTPLNGKVLLVLIAVNAVLLAVNIKKEKPNFKVLFKIFLKKLDYRKFLLYFVLAILVAFLANLPVVWYDTYLYHLDSVRWLTDYGTVKGLANLHTRLGVNNTQFLLAAVMDNGIFNSASSHVMNSFLFSVLFFQLLEFLLSRKRQPNIIGIFVIFSLLIMTLFLPGQINSLSTDFSLVIFVLVSVFYTFSFEKEYMILGIPLYALAATSKYSYFIGLILFLLFVLFLYRKSIFSKANFKFLMFIFLFFVGFMARNLLLSGWSFFPLSILGIPFQWQVPIDQVKEFSETVTAWARLPGPFYRSSLNVGFWGWFIKWFNSNKQGMGMYYLLVSIALLFMFAFQKNKTPKVKFLVFANFAVVLYTFITAPDFRFMNISIFIVVALVLSSLLSDLMNTDLFRKMLVLTTIFLSIGNFLNAADLNKEPMLFEVQKELSGKVVPVTYKYTDQEFYLWKTDGGDQCGYSQLPCTPYDVKIKEFVPGNPGAGFYPTNEKPEIN